MGKGKRVKKLRAKPAKSISEKASEAFTRNFQEELRNSELWDEMVAQFGEERAMEILRKCKAQVITNMENK